MNADELLALAGRADARVPQMSGVPGIDFLPACATEAVSLYPVIAAPCSGCAFTAGTDANRHPITSADAQLCVERSHPFWCHMVEDGQGEKSHLCAGWVRALAASVDGEGK